MKKIDIHLNEHLGKILYIIAGCNGAGKTTAFRKRLSSQFNAPVFINADEIARQLCPTDVESVAVQAGRMMLQQIEDQLEKEDSFCIETTLSTRHYQKLVKKAQSKGFIVALFFYWLVSPELAVLRVAKRVESGGHNIPKDVILRRYERGLANLFSIYIPIVDYWHIDNNSEFLPIPIAEGSREIYDNVTYKTLESYGK